MTSLWKYRQYIFYTAVANLKSQILKNHLGLVWLFLEPVLKMSVYYLVFVFLLNKRTVDFTAFLLIGVMTWGWFSSSVNSTSRSISGFKGIKQIHIPKIVLPTTKILLSTFNFLIVFSLFLVLQAIQHGASLSWVSLPLCLGSFFVLVYGASVLLASISPLIPDVNHIAQPLLQTLMFCSGIFYKVTPDQQHYHLFMMNPVAKTLEQLRLVIIDRAWPEWQFVPVNVLCGFLLLQIGRIILRKYEYVYPRTV